MGQKKKCTTKKDLELSAEKTIDYYLLNLYDMPGHQGRPL